MALRVSLRDAWVLGARDLERARPRKYRNRPGELDGHRFDSQLELKRYCYLLMVERAGQLKNLIVHPKYPIFAASWKHLLDRDEGTMAVEIGVYEGDFEYHDAAGELVVEDTKGVVLPLYKLKRAIFLANYPRLRLVEVRLKHNRWVSKVVSSGDRHDQ